MADAFNFTSGMGVQDIGVPGRDLPAFGQAQALQQSMQRMHLEGMRWSMHEKAANMQLQIQARQGMAEMNGIMAESLGPSANPDEILRRLYDTGSRYAIPPEQFDSFIKTAEFMKQRREFANRFAGGSPQVGGNQTLTTKYKDPITGAEYTVQDKPDQKTFNIRDLEYASKLEDMAKQLDDMGLSDKAQGFRRDAELLRGGVEKVDQRTNSLDRQLDNAETDLAGLKALATSKGPNHKIQTLGQSVSAAIVQKEAEVKTLRKRLAERKAEGGEAPQEGSPADPLGLFEE